jgi:hypothetical protein
MDQDVFFSLAFANVSCGKTFVDGKSHYFLEANGKQCIALGKVHTVTIHLHQRRLISWGTSHETLHWGKAIISRDNTLALGQAFL